MSRDTVAEIDTAALRHNLGVVREMAPRSRVVGVVKADGYGHGIGTVAGALATADVLAVATIDEGRAVRESGWGGRLLLLEGFASGEEYDAARSLAAEFVVHEPGQLALLEARGAPGELAWLKLDTGMHRLGFPPADAAALRARLVELTGASPPVLMTHFACADDPASPMTGGQLENFAAAVRGLDGDRSLANSAALINFPEARAELVRPGILLYGVSPVPGKTGADHGLRPVMTLRCPLLAINQVRAGDTLGYGARYRCPEDMPVGVAAIGYGDGYPWTAADGTPVLVNGRRARLAGRVSMDMITVDLRGHEDARVGDTVTLWGDGLPVEEVAAHAGLIPYQLVCGVTGRVRRAVL